jgi:hypothetical protein
MINAVKANIPLCPFAKAFTVSQFRRLKPKDAPRANHADKGFGIAYPVQPEVQAHQIPPLFVVQLRCLKEVSTLHRHLDPLRL